MPLPHSPHSDRNTHRLWLRLGMILLVAALIPSAWARVLLTNEYMLEYENNDWVIDANNDLGPSSILLQFGTVFAESISYNTSEQVFEISDTAMVQGDVHMTQEIIDSAGNTGAPGEVLVADGVGGNYWTPVNSSLDVQQITGDAVTTADILAAQGSITLHRFDGIAGTSVASLTSAPAFPDNPSVVSTPTIFEAPTDLPVENYGNRMFGYVIPPQTGLYTFWIASDDNSALYLSSDEDPSHKVQIASVGDWTSPRQWNKFLSQQSLPIMLVSGNVYYIEALMKEGVNLDNLAVGWQLPNLSLERPIPGSRLATFIEEDNTYPIALSTDVVTVDTTEIGVMLELPDYTGSNRRITIQHISSDGNPVVIQPPSGHLIDGATSLTIAQTGPWSVILQSDGVHMHVVSSYNLP